MATSPWRAYLNRSMEHLRDRTAEGVFDSDPGLSQPLPCSHSVLTYQVNPIMHASYSAMRMDPARSATEALQLLSFRTPEDLEQVALGCDGDVGAYEHTRAQKYIDRYGQADI
jgi:hypothetical protein